MSKPAAKNNPRMSAKAEEIRRILAEPTVDLWKLRDLALTEGGLVNDVLITYERAWVCILPSFHRMHCLRSPSPSQRTTDSLRRLAWPRLAGVRPHPAPAAAAAGGACADSEQIARDVSRVTWHLLTGNQRQRNFQMKNKHRNKRITQLLKRKQRRLGDFLNLVLVWSCHGEEGDGDEGHGGEGGGRGATEGVTTPNGEGCKIITEDEGEGSTGTKENLHRLRYYQGFHDVASIFLSVLGGASSSVVVPSLATATTTATSSSATTSTPLGENNRPVTRSMSQASRSPPQSLKRKAIISSMSESNRADSTASSLSPSQLADNNPPDSVVLATTGSSTTGLTLAAQVLLRVARSHFRDALRANFLTLQSALKLIVMPLVATFDPELHAHLYDCEMEPYFCLSWIITWFSHDVRDTSLVKRLYDFFLVSHPLMSVYISVAMMVHPLNRIEVLSADCDFACVHHALADLPKNSSNVGWKYLPGEQSGGYVTGEDDDGSADAGSLQEQSLDYDHRDDGSMASSSMAEASGNRAATARVPFQELIDLSISFMHKVPPRNLLHLARRYHDNITIQVSSIAMLQPPPSWGLACTAESDWILRQKLREECGLTKLNRHQRKNRNKLLKQGTSSPSALASDHQDKRQFQPPSLNAKIASGTGPDGQAEAKRLRKKRRMLRRSSALVAVISVLVALVKRKFFLQPPLPLAEHPGEASFHLQKEQMATKDDNDVLGISGVASFHFQKEQMTTKDDNDVLANEHSHQEPQTDFDIHAEERNLSAEDKKEDKEIIQDQEQGKNELIPPLKKMKRKDACDNDESADGQEDPKESRSINEEYSIVQTDAATALQGQCGLLVQSKLPLTEENRISKSVQHEVSLYGAKEEEPNSLRNVLLSTVLLFMKNTTRIHTSHLLESQRLRLEKLEHDFDLLMLKSIEIIKAGWSKVSPILLKALHIGSHHLKLKSIAFFLVMKDELASELGEGRVLGQAKDTSQIWKKQQGFLKKHGGNLIHQSGAIVSDTVRKFTKTKKNS